MYSCINISCFRYYFKTLFDGKEVLEEVIDDSALVPMIGQNVNVNCMEEQAK